MAKKSAKKVTKKSPGKKRGRPAKAKPAPMTRVRRTSAEIDEACEKVKQALLTASGTGEKLSVEKACNMYGLTSQAFYRCKDRATNKELAEIEVKLAGDTSKPKKTLRDIFEDMSTALFALHDANETLGTTPTYSTDEVVRFIRTFKDKVAAEL